MKPLRTRRNEPCSTFTLTLLLEFGSVGNALDAPPDAINEAAPAPLTYPAPWSSTVEPSESSPAFAEAMIALRIWLAVAAGNAWRSSAATPATLGAETL